PVRDAKAARVVGELPTEDAADTELLPRLKQERESGPLALVMLTEALDPDDCVLGGGFVEVHPGEVSSERAREVALMARVRRQLVATLGTHDDRRLKVLAAVALLAALASADRCCPRSCSCRQRSNPQCRLRSCR